MLLPAALRYLALISSRPESGSPSVKPLADELITALGDLEIANVYPAASRAWSSRSTPATGS